MSIDWGNVPLNSVIPFVFTSHDAATGANETMSGLALADIIIYKGTSLTQRSSTAGFAFFGGDADGLDLDTFTGVNGVSIDTSDNTDAGFFAAGSFYTVVLGPITVDAQTVYSVIGTFRLTAAEGVAGVPDVNVTHVGDTAQTAGDLKASLNTIDDFIDTEIADIQARLPAALVGGRIDASVGAVAAAAIGAAAFAAGALDAVWSTATRVLTAGTNIVLAKGVGVTGFNDLSAANVNAEVVDALATDTYAEPGQGAPAATASLSAKVGWLYKLMRNRITQTATTLSIYNDDAVTVDTKSTVSDNGTTYDRGELVSGP